MRFSKRKFARRSFSFQLDVTLSLSLAVTLGSSLMSFPVKACVLEA